MANRRNLSPESYIRDLPVTLRSRLSMMLDPMDMWVGLVSEIPDNKDLLLSDSNERNVSDTRYMSYNLMTFRGSPSPTQAFLEDWGTDNTKVKHLLKALLNVGLVEAANVICTECENPVPMGASHSPSSSAGRDEEEQGVVLINRSPRKEEACLAGAPYEPDHQVPTHLRHGSSCGFEKMDLTDDVQEISFETLRRITGNFDERDITQGGSLLGKGGFGVVFLGQYLDSHESGKIQKVAVKCLKDTDKECQRQFQTEVKTLRAYKHENLVTLRGYSSHGASLCLVYEFVVNGSLEDRLACQNGTPHLSVSARLDIARGTSRGIEYLHSKGVTHRDIKTANILLDSDLCPKVSDFGTALVFPKMVDNIATQVHDVTTVIGATPYLAPEAFSFKVHHGLDVFSFGVVLLELLTGLPVFDLKRETADLKIYVKEYVTPCPAEDSDDDDDEGCFGSSGNGENADTGSILDLADRGGGLEWDPQLVEAWYSLAEQCLETNTKRRKKIAFVVSRLENMATDRLDKEVYV